MHRVRSVPVRVFGVGHPERGDDAVGLGVARLLRGRVSADVVEVTGDPLAMIPEWEVARLAIVVDAMCGGGPPGTVRRFDATRAPLPVALATATSSHGVGVSEAIELARALRRLPERLIVVGVEGGQFALGSAPDAEACAEAARVVRRLLRTACPHGAARPGAPSCPVETPPHASSTRTSSRH
jgi:hydrogenase maturation protease